MNHIVIASKLFFECGFVPHFLVQFIRNRAVSCYYIRFLYEGVYLLYGVAVTPAHVRGQDT